MTPRGSVIHWLRRLARNLRRGADSDAELSADLRAYVDLLTDENTATGMAPDAARRAALLAVGGIEAVKEDVRAVRAGALVAQLWQDVRYAARVIRRDPAFSLVVILTLALGIGANTAIFGVVNAVLLRPLAYPEPDRLVLVWERSPAIGKDRDPVAPLNFEDWRRESRSFDALGAWRFSSFALSRVEDPEQLRAVAMTSDVFRALRVTPLAGRVFTEEEGRRRARVVVLAHEFWQRRFGGDLGMVGRSITLNAIAYTVIGVMPPTFGFPDGNPVDMYAPLAFSPDELAGRRSHTLTVIGRLAPSVSIEAAQADVETIASRIAAQDVASNPEVTVVGAHDALVEDVRLALLILLATVGFVLLIACANVANLLLVRGASRRREIAIRAALGASRARLVRQLLSESVLLSTLGAMTGTFMAWGLVRVAVLFGPPDLPRIEYIGIDGVVVWFASAVGVSTGVTFGIAPALQTSRRGATEGVGRQDRNGTMPFARARGRSMLLLTEIALTLMLLAGAGLMLRSLVRVQDLDLGFDPTDVLTAQMFLPATRYPIDPTQFRPVPTVPVTLPDSKPAALLMQLEERLRAVPGVESVGAVSALPLDPGGADYDLPVLVEGRPRPRPGEEPQADFRIATPGYFQTLGIPLTRGREFTDFDGPNSPSVAIINETMARELFPGEDPLGKQLVLYGRPREIIGVVGSVRHRGFTGAARPEMLLPSRQFQLGSMTMVVRSSLDAAALKEAFSRTVHALDPSQPVFRMRMMHEFLEDSVAQPRFTTLVLGGFAGLAVVLSLVGVYGVISYSVAQRTREFGVRLALGANPLDIIGMVVQRGMVIAMAGIVIGLIGAAAGTRVMAGLLFGVTATDPPTFAAAAAGLVVASLLAMCIPAIRAARIAPVISLKSD